MEKGNKKRLVITSLLFIICFGLFITGYMQEKKGYGETGGLIKELTPIIDKFNSLNAIKNNKNKITASFSNDMIVVRYITTGFKDDYEFKYNKIANLNLLEFSYYEEDNPIATEVAKYMLETISVLNGNAEGKLDNLNYENLFESNTKQGAYLVKKGNLYTITINVNANLYYNLENNNFSEDDIPYIISDDIKDMMDLLNESSIYFLTKDTILLGVYSRNDSYEIYISDSENNESNIYESVMTVLNVLNKKVYNSIANAKITFNKNTTQADFKIELNPETDSSINVPNPTLKLTVSKQKSE